MTFETSSSVSDPIASAIWPSRPAVSPAPKSMKTAIPFAVEASTTEPASESAAMIATPRPSAASGASVRSGHQPPSASVSSSEASATPMT